jgi:hypothetical protein
MSKIEVNELVKQSGSTLTIGGPGTAVTLGSGATQTGFGTPSSSVLWCTTAKTSPFTAVDKVGYFVNTTGGSVTVTLPSSPSAGDVVAFKDYASTWDSNVLTLCRNGSKIGGVCSNADLNTRAQSVTLIYVDGTKGWQDIQDSSANISGSPNFIVATGGTVVTTGDFKTHIFTASGCFAVTTAPTPGNNTADYFVVAGGGGGAGQTQTAGAGAGGFRVSNDLCVAAPTMSPLSNPTGISISSSTTYPITVGAGGAAVGACGAKGSSSIFSSITSAGGGASTGGNVPAPSFAAGSGGSGAGQRGENPNGASVFSGNEPPVSPPQGNNGGQGGTSGSCRAAGGGGGAGAVGTNASSNNGGTGGIGSFIGDAFIGPTAPSYGTPGPVSSTRYFAGGGGGGVEGGAGNPAGTNGAGGEGGGGRAGPGPTSPGAGVAATANTGGGGGGTSRQGPGASVPTCTNGGAGGSGIVMIRYKFQ